MTPKSIFRDKDLCVNCKSCIIACKVKHMAPSYPGKPAGAENVKSNLIEVFQVGPEIHEDSVWQAFVGIACMHCEDPPCMKVCPFKAIYKHPDAHVTLVNKEMCIGCKMCLWACPYGVPSFDGEGKLMLCDLCLDRLKEGKKTACEAACQARAITVGSPDEIKEKRARQAARKMAVGFMDGGTV